MNRDPNPGSTQTPEDRLQHPTAEHGGTVPGLPPPHTPRASQLCPLTWTAPPSMAATSPMAMVRVCTSTAAPGPRAGLTQARCSMAATNSSTCQRRAWGRAVRRGDPQGSPRRLLLPAPARTSGCPAAATCSLVLAVSSASI